jgi:hypothetical protein
LTPTLTLVGGVCFEDFPEDEKSKNSVSFGSFYQEERAIKEYYYQLLSLTAT